MPIINQIIFQNQQRFIFIIMQKQETQQKDQKTIKKHKSDKNEHKFIFTQNMLKQLLQACRKTLIEQNKLNHHVRGLVEINIRPITFHNIPILRNSLQNYLRNDKVTDYYQRSDYGITVLHQYIQLQQILRELSIINPVLDTFFTEYIQHLSSLPSQKQIKKQHVLQKWNSISYRNLSNYLYKFNIVKQFQELSKDNFEKELMMCLAENKIMQCCQYYKLYDCQKGAFQEFQNNQLIPKLSKSDHLFSEHVIGLLEKNAEIKKKVLEGIDPLIGIRLVQALKQDARQYKNIHQYILRQHYKSFLHEHKHYWYILEDKLSFSQKFIEYYTQELLKNPEDNLKWSVDQEDVTNFDVAYSILQRHGKQFPQIKFKYVQNPLYKYDFYGSVQTIFYDINHHALGKHTETQKEPQQIKTTLHVEKIYLDLSKAGLIEQQVVFIQSSQSQQFQIMYEHLIKSVQRQQESILVGFDTEFKCAQTKFDNQGVSIMQLATKKYGFLIDFKAIQKEPKFILFMKQFLSNQKIIKIGHTIDADMKEMSRTFPMGQNRDIKSFIDIVKIFKEMHPGSKYTSLSYMCDVILGRKLSKYEQRSNWNRRPLKKTQIHYAISDAYACLLLLQKLQTGSQLKNFEQKYYDKQSLVYSQIIRDDNLVYSKKYQHILSNKKFLVDNMMRKLCGTMRNCGMDAEFLPVKNHQLAIQMAVKQQRTIVTRDSRLFNRKQQSVPIYFCSTNAQSEQILQQLVAKLKINLHDFATLSRCVKCNNPDLVIIDRDQAMKIIFFQYQDSTIKQFWRCSKCKQIYWQGNQFKKAHIKYDNLKKQTQEKKSEKEDK